VLFRMLIFNTLQHSRLEEVSSGSRGAAGSGASLFRVIFNTLQHSRAGRGLEWKSWGGEVQVDVQGEGGIARGVKRSRWRGCCAASAARKGSHAGRKWALVLLGRDTNRKGERNGDAELRDVRGATESAGRRDDDCRSQRSWRCAALVLI
jgi:hypothetical protein